MAFPAPDPKLRTLLLFPRHLDPTPDTLPLLKSLQTLLNVSFTHGYCSQCPEIFGTSVVRLADLTNFNDFIRKDGFTLAAFADLDSDTDGVSLESVVELVASVSVKVVDEEVARIYSQCAGWGRAEKSPGAGIVEDYSGFSVSQEEILGKFQDRIREWQNQPPVYEGCILATSPRHQGSRLAVRLMGLCEWLVVDGVEVLEFARSAVTSASGVEASLSTVGGTVRGIDVDELRKIFESQKGADGMQITRNNLGEEAPNGSDGSLGLSRATRLVTITVRKLNREDDFRKRGFSKVGTGVLPVGTWDNKVECSVAFMEKDFRHGCLHKL